jgi:hypothetical protein
VSFPKLVGDNIDLRIDTIALHRPTKFANALDVNKALRTHSKYPRRGGLVGADAQMAISAVKTQPMSKENLMDTVISLLFTSALASAERDT